MTVIETSRVIDWMRAAGYSDKDILDLIQYVAAGSDVTEEVEPNE